MKLLEQLPELEEKIEQGDLNLTQMGIANAFFGQQASEGNTYTTEQKKEVFEEISGCSTRTTQAKLADKSPNKKPIQERAKPIGNGRIDFRCELKETTLAKLKKLKSKYAHKKFTTDELLNFLCDQALEENPAPKKPKENSKSETLRRVWNRDMHKCTNCGSDHALQVDHIIPRAKGGQDTLENLRLLCRSCNQRAAIEELGQEKMDPYINQTRGAASDSAADKLKP
jgi:5-methylcytosine-specific restriction endonuclease McrA